MGEIRVGLVGTGWVAQDRYLPVLRRLKGVRIVGIADRNVERGAEVARQYGVTAHTDASQLLDIGPEVLFVCTSPFSHASISIDAMRAGAHVFVEKPMAITNDEAAEMVAVANETGKRLGVSHNMLFSRSVRAARRRIQSGRLGKVHFVKAIQASSPNRRLPHWYSELPGGLFFDEAPHMFYLLDSFLGGLTVDHAWSHGSDGQTSLGADFIGEDGARGQLTMIFDAPISEWFLAIFCDKGVVVVDLFRDIQFVIGPDGGHRPLEILRTSLYGILGHGIGTVDTGVRYLSKRQFWGHDVIISDFVDSVMGRRNPSVTGEDGARVVGKMIEVLDVTQGGVVAGESPD